MNELLNLAWQDILSFLFVFVRVGTIFALVPFFGSEVIARRITAIIAFFLSGLMRWPLVNSATVRLSGLLWPLPQRMRIRRMAHRFQSFC
mgnify:CR=1 FL=1